MERWKTTSTVLGVFSLALVVVLIGLWVNGNIVARPDTSVNTFALTVQTSPQQSIQPNREISRVIELIEKGEVDHAEPLVKDLLENYSKNVQIHFLQGVILAEQGKTREAIEVFKVISKEYPELPEAYNNLAVLYAANHQYEEAKNVLLEAINTHSSYATTYQNLSDIYAIMAGMAYDKALQLWQEEEIPKTSLALIIGIPSTSFIPTDGSTGTEPPILASSEPPDSRSEPAPPPDKAPEKTSTPAQLSSIPNVEKADVPRIDKPDNTPVPARKTVEEPGLSPPVASNPPEGQTALPDRPNQDEKQSITNTISAWAQAWSAQDAEQYLSFYGPEFQVPSNMSRKVWEQTRRDRVRAPNFIEVTINDIKVLTANEEEANVRFVQSYRSNSFRSVTNKKIWLKKVDDVWKFVREAVDN